MTTQQQLRFRKTNTFAYRADGQAHSYVIAKNRNAGDYELTVFTQNRSIEGLILLDSEVASSIDDLLRDAKAVAIAYESLVDFKSYEHGHCNRMTVATIKAYAND